MACEKMKKTTSLLFSYKGDGCRLTSTSIGSGGASGIQCSLRESGVNSQAKYSTVALILDKIFLDKDVTAYESSDSIYVHFMDDGIKYDAVCDGQSVEWSGSEPSKQYLVLLPHVVYALSNAGLAEDSSFELRSYFSNIKNNENVLESVLLFCDAFYYGYTVGAGRDQTSYTSNTEILNNLRAAVSNGIYVPMSLLSGISNVSLEVDSGEDYIVVEEDKKSKYLVEYGLWDEALWDEETLAKIPSQNIMKDYVETKETNSLARKIKYRLDKIIFRLISGLTGIEAIAGDYINVLLVGRPGTGKTFIANIVAYLTGLPIYSIPISKNTEEDTFEGKNKVKEGKIDFVDTEFLKAYEHGGIILLEEINLADPAVIMGSLGQAIEFPFLIMKDGYVPVRRHPLCVIIATMNTGTAGSKRLNQALSSRFKNTYVLDDPDKNTFIRILKSKGYEEKRCKYVYDIYQNIIEFLKSPQQNQLELCENITLRGCFGALECWEEGDDPKTAIKNSLVGKIAEINLDVARKVETDVVDSFHEFEISKRRGRR